MLKPKPPSPLAKAVIRIRGARTHNLRNIDLDIPKNQLVVITGLSGSGKSSLAFDTLYAEGQRRYVESLSAYARQFLQMMDKPDVDSIEGLSPAIAIEQKATSHNPRSTVGTVTEIHDYLRLLFARVGTAYCPTHGVALEAQTVSQMVDMVLAMPAGTKIMLLSPIARERKGEFTDILAKLQAQGFMRCRINGQVHTLDNLPRLKKTEKHNIDVVVDRLAVQVDKAQRLAESFETALRLGDGRALVVDLNTEQSQEKLFNAKMACPHCNFGVVEMEPRIFSFNSPMGACPKCDGLGEITFFDPSLVSEAKTEAEAQAIVKELEKRFAHSHSQLVHEHLSQYRRSQTCPDCEGTRLRLASRHVRVGQGAQAQTLPALSALSLKDCAQYFGQFKLSGAKAEIATKVVKEISARLRFLNDVGLNYLSLSRGAHTLSGGEAQRIRLASQIGSGLTGVMYVLDEPSIGLHQRDNDRLMATLLHLRDLGNSVLVVEHDEDMIRAADHLIDIGPGAGVHGGQLVAQGTAKEIAANPHSATGRYLAGIESIAVPAQRTPPPKLVDWLAGHVSTKGEAQPLPSTSPADIKATKAKKQTKVQIKLQSAETTHEPSGWLRVEGATGNNLQQVNVDFPLGLLTCVTGVSGSGKSTLVNDTLYKALAQHLHRAKEKPAPHTAILGQNQLDKVVYVDQAPIGRTPRSNPATYTGLFTPIRELMAQVPLARERGYGPGRFSFNVHGGRCEACQGDGVVQVQMHFLSDVYVACDICQGQRYNRETLEVAYKAKNIWQILQMTVEEALAFFSAVPAVARKLQILMEVGLSYVQLGQSATTLSGGEAQRIKLALELSRRETGKTLYILDEPTTGLHFADIALLLKVLHRLKAAGNTIVVIEHNLDVIKTADWLIDIGPEGGSGGGGVVATGTPEDLAKHPSSHTGKYLKLCLANQIGERDKMQNSY